MIPDHVEDNSCEEYIPLGDFDPCDDFGVNVVLFQSCLFWQKWKETCSVVFASLHSLNEVGGARNFLLGIARRWTEEIDLVPYSSWYKYFSYPLSGKLWYFSWNNFMHFHSRLRYLGWFLVETRQTHSQMCPCIVRGVQFFSSMENFRPWFWKLFSFGLGFISHENYSFVSSKYQIKQAQEKERQAISMLL